MRYCLAPGCGTVVERGYCPPHAKRREGGRGSAASRGYDWQWTKRARRFLERYPVCGMRPGGRVPVLSACALAGIATPATDVDHVIPHRGDPALRDDLEGNCQALCTTCHVRKTRAGQ